MKWANDLAGNVNCPRLSFSVKSVRGVGTQIVLWDIVYLGNNRLLQKNFLNCLMFFFEIHTYTQKGEKEANESVYLIFPLYGLIYIILLFLSLVSFVKNVR
jgi:hypothetical protein